MLESPIFIGGASRSGTTLMRVILDSHPLIFCGPEFRLTPFLASLHQIWDESTHVKNMGLKSEEIDLLFANLYETLISREFGDSNKKIFAEKTPGNCRWFFQLKKIFPDARFIHVIRDGRDVVCSLLEQKWIDIETQKPMSNTTDFSQAVLHWKDSVQSGLEFCQQNPDHSIQIHYETLVSEPEQSTRILCNFLKIEWDSKMLDFTSKKRSLGAEASANQVSKPLYLNSIKKWQSRFNKTEQLFFEQLAGQLLKECGYE